MSKYISNTVIQLEFLNVETGDQSLITIPEDSNAEDLAHIIRDELHAGGVILTEIYIDHEFKKED